MKTITLKENPMKFDEALRYLFDGKCCGIRPGNNTGYIVPCRPRWMNQGSPDFVLVWHGEEDSSIRSNQFLEDWFPVIVDHRELKK